jgi:uncharacterized protein YdeI (YjbR/CyaY-like superfamily)
MRFRTTVFLGGKTATGLEVPADMVEALGPKKRVPVVVTINGHSYGSAIAPYGGSYFLPLSAENRVGAGVAADEQPREIAVPDDLASALDGAGKRAAFDALSYSRKRGIVEPIEAAKASDTRQRRIDKTVGQLG